MVASRVVKNGDLLTFLFGVYPCYDYSAVHTWNFSVGRFHRP
jgi:hypothetical protein